MVKLNLRASTHAKGQVTALQTLFVSQRIKVAPFLTRLPRDSVLHVAAAFLVLADFQPTLEIETLRVYSIGIST